LSGQASSVHSSTFGQHNGDATIRKYSYDGEGGGNFHSNRQSPTHKVAYNGSRFQEKTVESLEYEIKQQQNIIHQLTNLLEDQDKIICQQHATIAEQKRDLIELRNNMQRIGRIAMQFSKKRQREENEDVEDED
jgi:hypothetical protein